MRLLVSVRNADEARAALEGGADIIDAKEPARGALGVVEPGVLREIQAAVGHVRATSAALGDAGDEAGVERATREAAALGLDYVKIGFRGVNDPERVRGLLAAAVRGARAAGGSTAVIAVAYADAARVASPAPGALIDIAGGAGARGVLLDTALKDGGGLLTLMTRLAVSRWIGAAHQASLTVALAGKLTGRHVAILGALGAEIIGVRGAACDGGREGRVSEVRVRGLVNALGGTRSLAPAPPPLTTP